MTFEDPREYWAMLDNLTATQTRCTELLEEVRRLRAEVRRHEHVERYLEERGAHDYPIVKILLKTAREFSS
jgi:hypothetical protein